MQLKYACVLIKTEDEKRYMPSNWLKGFLFEERCISELHMLEGRLTPPRTRNGQMAYAVSQGQKHALKVKSDSLATYFIGLPNSLLYLSQKQTL